MAKGERLRRIVAPVIKAIKEATRDTRENMNRSKTLVPISERDYERRVPDEYEALSAD